MSHQSSNPTTNNLSRRMQQQIQQSNPKQPCSLDHIKLLGKRTRQRLDDERNKRKEIIRLGDTTPHDTTTTTHNKLSPITTTTTPSKRKRRQQKQQQQQPPRRRRTTNNKNNNRRTTTTTSSQQQEQHNFWIPDISHLAIPLKTNRSPLIRCHALPIGVTLEAILSFFTGLNPCRVMILPPLVLLSDDDERRMTTEALTMWSSRVMDASYEEEEDKKNKGREREDMRVYVSFESVNVASVALERSGEMMKGGGGVVSGGGKECGTTKDRQEVIRCAVALSPVETMVGSFLSSVAFDAVKGEPLRETYIRVKSNISPLVADIIAIMTAKALSLSLPSNKLDGISTNDDNDDDNDDDKETLSSLHILRNYYSSQDNDSRQQQHMTTTTRDKLTTDYNSLVTVWERLERDVSPENLHLFDQTRVVVPSLDDPVLMLTNVASHWLLDELDQILIDLRLLYHIVN